LVQAEAGEQFSLHPEAGLHREAGVVDLLKKKLILLLDKN
jgi:hypothetical protein